MRLTNPSTRFATRCFLPNGKADGIEQRYRVLQVNGYSAYFDVDESSNTIEIMRVLKSEQQ